ncbi:MAG: hypothetical protein N2255_00510 [Kiritimatiellae bacterium]|jgi:hypothetical protein|nr:hypothetical protein [Kiritimatiellia bacterium]
MPRTITSIIHELGWKFLTQVTPNRQVNPDDTGNCCISDCEISQTGTIVHLNEFGFVKAFRIVNKDGHAEHWISKDLEMVALNRLKYAELAWGIEEYHKGLKQHTGVENCQTRMAKAQKNHISFSIRAFLKLEWLRFSRANNWSSGKRSFLREAIRWAIANLTWDFPESLSDVDFFEPATV